VLLPSPRQWWASIRLRLGDGLLSLGQTIGYFDLRL